MEQPESRAGNRIVIAWIPKIQEAKNVLVHEVKPEKAVILARRAMHREIEIGWQAQRRQNVPRRSNQQKDDAAGNDVQSLPEPPGKYLLCEKEVDKDSSPN